MTLTRILHCSCIFLAVGLAGCSADDSGRTGGGDLAGGGGGDGGGGTDDAFVPGGDDGGFVPTDDGMLVVEDPKTCDEAAMNKSYIGCDYWPTTVANAVWNIFDFAVVVSNPGTTPADVTVTGPPPDAPAPQTPTNIKVTVMPGTLQKIYLPWKKDLKGNDATKTGDSSNTITASIKATGLAYHLVSSVPVLVYQFSALEYAPMGGPAGKDWSTCPGDGKGFDPPCFSYSNDASLLLPSTAMTGNYRVVTNHGTTGAFRGYFAVTATQDSTTVKVKVSSTGVITAGTGVTAVAAGGTSPAFTLNAGDVLELLGDASDSSDLSGSLVQADKPVQVIGGEPCYANPSAACDHIEESVLPAETLGKDYVVTAPTGPKGDAVAQTVRIVGNVDGTKLTFSPSVNGAPGTINAGQVMQFDANVDFEVTGDHEFAVATIQKSGSVVDPMGIFSTTPSKGDPSLSEAIAVKQFRLKYVFLAPDDYPVNYADVVAPSSAKLTLDGAAVSVTGKALGTSGFSVFRIKLQNANGGAHTLDSDQPCGLQVLGYGSYTSYQYPGGLNLISIAPPPPPIS